MNYEIIYSNLITTRLEREIDPNEYYEKHHIWPSSIGGSNNKENLVHLTGREHFIAHKLLYKITEGEDKKKMLFARLMMVYNHEKYITSWEYERLRKLISEDRKGKGNPNYECKGDKNPFYGKHHTEETKEILRLKNGGENSGMFGKKHSDETIQKMKETHTGKKMNDEHRRKTSERQKGVKKSSEFCRKISDSRKGKKRSKKEKESIRLSKLGEKNPMYGKKLTEEHKRKIGEKSKGKTISEEHKNAISKASKGRTYSEESKKRMSESHKGKKQQIVECPYCGKSGGITNMKRFHFENCKFKKESN